MHSFRDIPIEDLQDKKEMLVSKFKELCSENDIRSSFNSGSQSKIYILRRRKLWQEKLNEVFSKN
jgi:hypothetical protein